MFIHRQHLPILASMIDQFRIFFWFPNVESVGVETPLMHLPSRLRNLQPPPSFFVHSSWNTPKVEVVHCYSNSSTPPSHRRLLLHVAVDLTDQIHQFPSCINHDRPSLFLATSDINQLVDGLNVKEVCFKGRKLQGTTFPLRDGYSGWNGKFFHDIKYFAETSISAALISEMIKRIPTIDFEDQQGTTIDSIKGEVELKDVYFEYPSRPKLMVLKKFNLKDSEYLVT
ncbi:hypothetical protein Lser_V15G15740 [Lactuca serriola]